MPEVQLVRRWGAHQPGETVDVDEQMCAWLVDNSFGETDETKGSATSGAAAPGTDGPDPRAGGDSTRLRMTSEVKGSREGERARSVGGNPGRPGDVTHVAEENRGLRNIDIEVDEDGARVLDKDGKVTWSSPVTTQSLRNRFAAQRQADEQGESKSGKGGNARQASGKSSAAAEDKDAADAKDDDEPAGRRLTQPKKK